jgi:hypothetical protein
MRFVILEHDHPERHWDFMVETRDVLRTWRLLALPASGSTVAAEPSFDHRLIYLDYEGPVSGGRGHVVRWDRGTFVRQEETAERLVFRLTGARLQGTAVLEQTVSGAWQFTIHDETQLGTS